MRTRGLVFGNALVVCLLAAASAWGQGGTNSGVIAGEVDDSSGAKVSGAKVEIASPALIERVRDTVTGDDGLFKIVNVPPGIYSVTATQSGFSTVKRDNIEITTGFTATLNFSLTPGSVEQTVTVSTEAPVLDTQDSVVQKVLSNAVIEALPIGKSAAGYPSLVPGAVITATNQDVGGLKGENAQGFRIHGGASGDYQTLRDGMFYGTMYGGGTQQMSSNNPTATQEIQLETSGYSAEDWNTGGHVNSIPKNGGNELHGSFQADYGNKALQASNVTSALQTLGIKNSSSIRSLYEVAGGVGGPIKKDKLWFFADARHWVSSSNQAGSTYFFDANEFAPFPGNLYYAPDASRPAYDLNTYADIGLRLTWQASMKNKFTENWISEKNCNCFYTLSNGVLAPEATTDHAYKPNWRNQATWTFPVNNKLLLWAGMTAVVGTIDVAHTGDGPTNIPVTDQTHKFSYGTLLTGLNAGGTFGTTDFLNINENFTASYVTGPHAFKFGFTEMQARGLTDKISPNVNGANGYPFGVNLLMACQTIYNAGTTTPYNQPLDAAGLPTTSYNLVDATPANTYAAPAIGPSIVNGLPCASGQALLPSQVTEFLAPFVTKNTVETHAVFGQDQWRIKRLTINAGLRLDWFTSGSQAQTLPGQPQYGIPAKPFPAMNNLADWKDLNPRLGVAYDLFGNGKTAIKASLSRGVQQEGTQGIALLTTPTNLLLTNATRTFTDFNGNFMPDGIFTNSAANGELGKANAAFYSGASTANVTYASDVTQGWMNRPDNWQFSASIQQEILRGFALSFGYYRTWFGNQTVAKNQVPLADYDQYCVHVPAANAAYPGFGNENLCNLYDPIAADLTKLNAYTVEKASIFGNLSDVYNGIDLIANARFHGLILQGGLTAGSEVTNYCVQVNSPQDLTYWSSPSPLTTSIVEFANQNFSGVNDAAPCKITPPWVQNLQFKMVAVYTLPWWKIKLSANEQNLPSIPLQGSFSYKSANATFVGCPLSCPAGHPTGIGLTNTSSLSVEAFAPQTTFPFGRDNQLDFRVARDFTIKERWKIEPTADFYNLLNANPTLSIGTGFNASTPGLGGAWRNPTNILPARLIKFGVHVEF